MTGAGSSERWRLAMRWPRPMRKDPTSFRWWRMPVLARRRLRSRLAARSCVSGRGRFGFTGQGATPVEGDEMIAALCGAAPAGVRVLIATRPVDFRRGADGLAATVQSVLRQDPFSGTIFVFRSKHADRVKILVYDGTGLVLIWKRLEDAKFKWPAISDGVMRLSAAQLAALLEGLDWRRVYAARIRRPQVAG